MKLNSSPSVLIFRAMAMVAAPLLVAGCGPTVEVAREPVPELPNTAAPPLSGCNAPLWVPGGEVWLGPMIIKDGQAHARECNGETIGTARFFVKDAFLDADEVTNRCYQHCVDAGACTVPVESVDPNSPQWTDPTARDFPAIVDYQRAADFCAFRGGRLASIAELARAAQGSVLSLGQPELLAAWTECAAEDFISTDCKALAIHARRPGDAPLRPSQSIRSEPRDIGPFGHYDLFGSQAEMSGSAFPSGYYPTDWCSEGTDVLSSVGNANGGYSFYVPGLWLAIQYIYQLNAPAPEQIAPNLSWYDPPGSLAGTRCAYDVVP